MTQPTPTRIGILGCGAFVRRYHVPALATMAEARVTLICDSAPNPAIAAAAETLGAAVTAEMGALLTREACDAVIISTPHGLHATHAAAALAAGLHVLCDKPFVMQVAEAEALAATAERAGLLGAVAFNRRLDTGCLRARDIIRAGLLGAVAHVETTQLGYESAGWFLDPVLGGGGPFTGRGSHMTDLVPWLTGAAPLNLSARTRPGPPGRTDRGGVADIAFPGFLWRMTCIAAGWHMWDEVRIFGEDGLIELRRPLHQPIGWDMRWTSARGTREEVLHSDAEPGAATRDFLAALRQGTPPACSFAQAAMSVRLMEAAFVSAREDGRVITFGREGQGA